MIPAHDSPLAALAFDASGTKLATASEKVRMRAPWRAGPQVSADSCAAHTVRLPAELLYLPTHSSTGHGPGFPDRGRSALQPHTRHGVQSEHTAGAGVQGGSRGVSGLTEQQDGPAQSRLLPCLST